MSSLKLTKKEEDRHLSGQSVPGVDVLVLPHRLRGGFISRKQRRKKRTGDPGIPSPGRGLVLPDGVVLPQEKEKASSGHVIVRNRRLLLQPLHDDVNYQDNATPIWFHRKIEDCWPRILNSAKVLFTESSLRFQCQLPGFLQRKRSQASLKTTGPVE